MNPQWSDEVKERYTKDQAFYAECSARGIQIRLNTDTVKLAVRNKPWVDLTDDEMLMIYGQNHEGKKYNLGRMVQQALKEKNNG